MRRWLMSEARRFWSTVLWSWQGWQAAWATEKALRQWALLQAVSIPAALALPLTRGERALIIALGFLVLAAELANTAIETVVNRINPDPSDMARKAKDCGSAMVALTVMATGVAWLVVLLG